MAPGTSAISEPQGYFTLMDNTGRVVYLTVDGHVHEIHLPAGQTWRHSDLTVSTGAPSGMGDPCGFYTFIDNTGRVVFLTADGHLHELYLAPDQGWQHGDLTALTDAPPAVGSPVGYFTHPDNTSRVVYRSADGHVHELFRPQEQAWLHADLTVEADAPVAADGPHAYVSDDTQVARVTYRGDDGHVHELFLAPGLSWTHYDLSEAVDAPAAVGAPFGYYTPAGSTSRVLFRSADGHLHEIYLPQGQAWQHYDLTEGCGAPAAAGDPHAFVSGDTLTARVTYRSADGHIHELFLPPGQRWFHGDLTAATGAPASVSNPIGHNTPSDRTSRVVFRTAEGHIHELYLTPGQTWSHGDLTVESGALPVSGIS